MLQDPAYPQSLSLLEELGLTRQEALVYSMLLGLGPSPAKRVAEATHIAREHTYQVLKRLEAKGLVDVVLTDQSLFVAATPRLAVGSFISRIDEESKEMREKAFEVGAMLQEIASRSHRPANDDRGIDHLHSDSETRIVYGRRVLHEFETELSNCKNECLVVQRLSNFRTSDGAHALDQLRRARVDGVNVTIVTDAEPLKDDLLAPLSREMNFRHTRASALAPRFAVFDRSRAMQMLSASRSSHDGLRSLFSTNPEMVNGLVNYFEILLSDARVVRNG